MYTTLLERYNPGMGADEGEGERVRLTARRVGMEMPREWYEKKKEGDGRWEGGKRARECSNVQQKEKREGMINNKTFADDEGVDCLGGDSWEGERRWCHLSQRKAAPSLAHRTASRQNPIYAAILQRMTLVWHYPRCKGSRTEHFLCVRAHELSRTPGPTI
jgi:Complex1_LYR-like